MVESFWLAWMLAIAACAAAHDASRITEFIMLMASMVAGLMAVIGERKGGKDV